MLETPHVALGIAIATKVGNPYLAVPLSFVSHFLLDMVPHWNPHLNTETKKYGRLTNQTLTIIGADLIGAALFTGFAIKHNISNPMMAYSVLLSSFSAMLPDIIEGPYYLFKVRGKLIESWIKFQKSIQSDANLFWGNLTQIIVLILCSLYIFS